MSMIRLCLLYYTDICFAIASIVSVKSHFTDSIFTALFGRINGLYGSNDSDDKDGNGRKPGSADMEDAGYPVSPLPGKSNKIDNIFVDFDSDFMPPGKDNNE